VQKQFENSLSLEEEFALSVKMDRGLAEVPKTVKSSIVEGDKWKQIQEFEDSNFGRIARRTIQSLRRAKCREILDREIQEDVWQRSTHSEEEPFGRKVKERIPKEMGAEAILSVHRERMRRERSMPSLIHKSGEVELREGRNHEV
jgi:hypothetical protein